MNENGTLMDVQTFCEKHEIRINFLEYLGVPDKDSVVFSPTDVENAIKDRKTEKACGRDGVYDEHLI